MNSQTQSPIVHVISWVNPNKVVRSKIQNRHPYCEIRYIPWLSFRKTFIQSTISLLKNRGTGIYFIIHDISQSVQIPYYEGLNFLFQGKNAKIMDLEGEERELSKSRFIFFSLPRLLIELALGAIGYIASLCFLWLVNMDWIHEHLTRRIERKQIRRRCRFPRVVGYYWGFLPDVQVNLKVGGEISHIIGFLDGMKKKGLESFLVSTRRIEHPLNPALAVPIDEKLLPAWPGEIREILYSWKFFFKSIPVVCSRKPVMIYHRSNAYNFSGLLVSLVFGLPLVMEFNSSEVWEAKSAGGTRFPYFLRLVEGVNTRYAKAISVISEQVKTQFADYPGALEKIVVNPNGVDPGFFSPGNTSAKRAVIADRGLEGKHVIGFLGVFFGYHGVLTLARSVKRVAEKIPDCHFLLIGDGLLRPSFEQIVEADGMSRHVTITGKIPHESVPAHLEACEVLVSPHQNMDDGSLFFGSPTKLFEYMAMAKPIVASKLGQLELILKHEKTALLIQPEDPEALAEAIARVILDPELGHILGKNARNLVVSSYTWEQNVERVLRPVLPDL